MNASKTNSDGIDKILDWFYSALDNALNNKDYDFVNKCLQYTEVDVAGTDTLLALLIHARLPKVIENVELPLRQEFYYKCEAEFKKRNPDNWKGLLEGLKV